MSIVVGKALLPELSKELMTTVLDLGFPLMDFHLQVLSNYFFLRDIFMVVLKKSSNFSSVPLFNIRFGVISSCLASGNVSILSRFRGIEDIRAPKCIQYPEEYMIESFTISSKHYVSLSIDV